MRTFFTGAISALMLGSVLMLSPGMSPAVAAEGKAAIDARLKLMKGDILKPYLAIKKYAKEGAGTAADVAKNAAMLSAAASKITALFPKGSGRGDFDDKTTRALPKIWQDWKGFEAAAARLGAEASKLAAVAASGDAAAIGAQFGMVGKNGCGGCHKPFRGAKVK